MSAAYSNKVCVVNVAMASSRDLPQSRNSFWIFTVSVDFADGRVPTPPIVVPYLAVGLLRDSNVLVF